MLNEQTPIPVESSQFVSAESLRVRLDWFNKLRWGAVAGILACILAAGQVLGYDLPLKPLLITVGVLALLNLLYVARNKKFAPVAINSELRLVKLQMLGDLVVLTILLNLTGGVENPFFYLYVIHVIIASLLFKGREIYQIAWLAIVLFTAEVLCEFAAVLPHHHLLSASEMTHELPFIVATLASFWLVMLFAAYMGASIMKHNRAIKDELVLQQAELVKADQAKTDFFRYVTHEVKTPVNTAQSAVETALELGSEQMSPKIRDLLQRGVRRLEQASDMVKNLADLTRDGLLKPQNLAVVEVVGLMRRITENFTEMAGRRNITLELETSGPAILMTTNQNLLEKVAGNLISNAVRYNRDGGQVMVNLTEREKEIELSVSDQGIGIAPGDQTQIFEEFFRTPAGQKASSQGTGLGLSIVRKFVAAMGGTVIVESEPGQGSRFTVRLPRHLEPQQETPEK